MVKNDVSIDRSKYGYSTVYLFILTSRQFVYYLRMNKGAVIDPKTPSVANVIPGI